MTTQISRAKTFAALHKKGDPVILYKIWDAGSAAAVRDAGAKALATGSASVAMVQGFADGQKIPFDMQVGKRPPDVEAVDIPVTIDLEGAYAEDVRFLGQCQPRFLNWCDRFQLRGPDCWNQRTL